MPAVLIQRPLRAAALAVAAALALGLGLGAPAGADDVHLANGKVFEGVVARAVGDQVEIRLAHGTLRLPSSQVLRIDVEATPLETWLSRRRALADDPGTSAADWLELALWARSQAIASGVREAARRAAALDPELPGLARLMSELGYARDPGGPWLLPDELMARRGLVRHGDSWITPSQRAEILATEEAAYRAAVDARRDRERDAVLVELAAAVRAQAEAQLQREVNRSADPWVASFSGIWFPLPVPVPPHHRGPHSDRPRPEAPDAAPQRPVEHHRNSFETRVPGSLGNAFVPGRLEPDAAPPPGRLSGHRSAH